MLSRLTYTSLWCFISPLVVSSNSIEQCGAASGCGQQASSLLQTRDSKSSMLMHVQGSSVQQSLVSATDFVTELAQRVVGHNIPLTADEQAALTTIEEFITRMLVEAVQQHAADQNLVNGAEEVMKTCNTDATTSLEGEVDDFLNKTNSSRTSHSDCRANQLVDNGTMDTDCQNYTQYRRLNKAAEPPQCMKDNHLAVGFVQTSNEEHQKVMESCMVKTKSWLDPLYIRYKACQYGTGNVTQRKAECDPKQTKFERSFCEYVVKHDDACSALDTCMANGRTNRETVHASIQVAEGARMGDWSAGKHVECLFTVFKADNKDKNRTFNDCHAETYDTAALKIDYPTDPDPVPCAKKTSKPCAGQWVQREYKDQAWFERAPTAECIPCSGHVGSGHVAYHLAPKGDNACDSGANPASKEACVSAFANLALKPTVNDLLVGAWGWVPPGCSWNTVDMSGDAMWPHWNTMAGTNNGYYTLACSGPARGN